jgi:hypothetical protein
MQSPIALGQLQIKAVHALAANAQLHLECSVVSARILKGKFMV